MIFEPETVTECELMGQLYVLGTRLNWGRYGNGSGSWA